MQLPLPSHEHGHTGADAARFYGLDTQTTHGGHPRFAWRTGGLFGALQLCLSSAIRSTASGAAAEHM